MKNAIDSKGMGTILNFMGNWNFIIFQDKIIIIVAQMYCSI